MNLGSGVGMHWSRRFPGFLTLPMINDRGWLFQTYKRMAYTCRVHAREREQRRG